MAPATPELPVNINSAHPPIRTGPITLLQQSETVDRSDLTNTLERLTQVITSVDQRLGILEGNVATLVEKAASGSNARSATQSRGDG